MTLTAAHIPTELIESYRDRKCGIFVGAGLSVASGLPDWKGLLVGLIQHGKAGHALTTKQVTELSKLAKDPSKFLILAEALKDALGLAVFKTYVEKTYTDPAKSPQPTHDLLVTLKRNRFIITTNYDLLIEKALVNNKLMPATLKYYEADAIQRQLFLRQFFLLKAHGDAQSGASQIVLTDKDYRKLLYQQPGYQSVLQSIFSMYSVIFIGCSLQDPELRLLLNYINAAFPEGGVPHYALLNTKKIGEMERGRWKKDYNMHIVPISADNNYADIDDFLKILHQTEDKAEEAGAKDKTAI
jgi:hypothetical protein